MVRKVKQSHNTPMDVQGREELYQILIHALGTRWGWMVSVTHLPHFTPGERTPWTNWTGGWVGFRAGLDTEVRGIILLPLPGIEPRSPGSPVSSQTLYWLSYPGSHILWYCQFIFRTMDRFFRTLINYIFSFCLKVIIHRCTPECSSLGDETWGGDGQSRLSHYVSMLCTLEKQVLTLLLFCYES
jgi:hypothetical protein